MVKKRLSRAPDLSDPCPENEGPRYALELHSFAEKGLSPIPANVRANLILRIRKLRYEPFPIDSEEYRSEPMCWRIDWGAWRIVYRVDWRSGTVTALRVGPRSNVYPKS